jgi:prepilin-type processing-associated H-X9-DG protein/prepilin-type N-terminal cleavage/methylation domain-containing protein
MLHTRNRKAFTIIELLVVITIMTLLMGLLLPGLKRTRGIGRTARCASNLGQIARGGTAHRAEDKMAGRTAAMASSAWAANTFNYMNQDQRGMVCPEDPKPHRSIPFWAVCWTSGSIGSGTSYDLEFEEGPFAQKTATDPNHYTLRIEDIRPSGGDRSFDDIVVTVAIDPNGTATVTATRKSGAAYAFQFMTWEGKATDMPSGTTTAVASAGPAPYTSYGANSKLAGIPEGTSGKVQLVDYYKDTVSPVDDWLKDGGDMGMYRHNGAANVLMCDGAVKTIPMRTLDFADPVKKAPTNQTNAQKYWDP